VLLTCSNDEMARLQVKTKGVRKISFLQFVDALALVAAKSGRSLREAAETVVAANGPSVSGTKADYVKFHDDKVSLAQLSPTVRANCRECLCWGAL
jgi:hypothetical protein